MGSFELNQLLLLVVLVENKYIWWSLYSGKIKFVGLDSWENWEKDLEGFPVTLLTKMGPMVTAAKNRIFVSHLSRWS